MADTLNSAALLKIEQGFRDVSHTLRWGLLGNGGSPNVVYPGSDTTRCYVRFPAGIDAETGVQKYEPPTLISVGVGAQFLNSAGRKVWVGKDPDGNDEIVRGDRLDLLQVNVNPGVTNGLAKENKAPSQTADNFVPLICNPVGTANAPSMRVQIFPLVYDTGGDIVRYNGTELAADKIDLTSFIPSSGSWCYVVIWFDTDANTPETPTASTPAALTSSSPNNTDAAAALSECAASRPNAFCIPVKAFYLTGDMTALTASKRHIDLRQMINMPSSGSGSTLPVVDTTALVKGSSDATKLLRFEVDGFTTGTTRVMTPPNYDGTLATLAGTEQFDNKTLVSPVINTGISGTAIVDDATFASPSSTKIPTTNAVKGYVDQTVLGLNAKADVRLATAAALATNVYSNGAAGVGATLTGFATGVLTVDGVTVALNDRLLVKNEVAGENNGIYKCTAAGAIGVAYVLTRSTDGDTDTELRGGWMVVTEGTVNASQAFVNTNVSAITFGSTGITFGEFSAGVIAVAAPITRTGNTIGLTTPLAVNYGGTHADLSATGGAGQFLKQSSAGADVTVGTIATADLPSAFYLKRVLTADLTVPDTACMVVSDYFKINAGVYLTLQGDATLEII